MDIRKEVHRLGFKVVFVPHKLIQDHVACYYVEYDGKRIRPQIAKRLHIPRNEIWISGVFRKQEEQILFHELQEIKYRRKGYSAARASDTRHPSRESSLINRRSRGSVAESSSSFISSDLRYVFIAVCSVVD